MRASALVALGRLGRLHRHELARALGDPEPSVRRKACEVAAASEVAGMLEPVTGALDDAAPDVVESACSALGEWAGAPDTVVGILARTALGHPEPLCREAAVAALGALGRPSGLPAVLSACSDKPAVRRRAVVALAAFEGPEVEAALSRALDDPDWQVRQAAEDLLGRG